MDRVQRIVELTQQAADRHEVFVTRGAGSGNRVTNAVMADLNAAVRAEMGEGVIQRRLGRNAQSVDFYLEPKRTVIEVKCSLCNPYPCLEKDLIKVLLANDGGVPIEKLLLVGDPGCGKRLKAPAPAAIIAWANRRFSLRVEVAELEPSRPNNRMDPPAGHPKR